MSEIKLENLSYFHGKDTPYEIKALDTINLTIPNGMVTGLQGILSDGSFIVRIKRLSRQSLLSRWIKTRSQMQ